MDKEWLRLSRLSQEYRDGARNFVNMARAQIENLEIIVCPCRKCKNLDRHHYEIVYEHLVINGMDPTYTTWVLHGEKSTQSVMDEDIQMTNTYKMYNDHMLFNMDDDVADVPIDTSGEDFESLVKDGETPLYPGCVEHTRMSATVSLFRLKVTHGLTDNSFDELLKIVKDILPPKNTLPKDFYATKALLKKFNLGYEKIHACKNDCCLFWKDLQEVQECPKCGSSRWKVNQCTSKARKVPAKVLRYFPIIPRLKRMFGIAEMATNLTWHKSNQSNDGKLRHPVDSVAWDKVNVTYPTFASDPRNIRFGIATDGFNPFQDLSTRYSCWPVILATYNLPPWLCMRRENLILTLLIPGPRQPGNDIDVYLKPLIEDLKELWTNGVKMYDAFNKSTFNLRAILLWTINDFPAYGNMSGWPIKGKFACPICRLNTCSQWLPHSRKFAYMGHRRFLACNHSFWTKRSWFNGQHENGARPKIEDGKTISNEVQNVVNDWGKGGKKRKKGNSEGIWKKKSIFFELPYWKTMLIRHNLDVMHIEKNICESIISTLLDVKGKSKDGLNARQDLESIGIRTELHPERRGDKFYLPPAAHTLSKAEKRIFCERLANLRLPDGYGSNIGKCIEVKECKIIGLKSHDCHMLMQHLLPVALRGLLPNGPRNAIMRLCAFFSRLCSRIVDRNHLEEMEDEVAETLCMLERFFSPSFFDIMIHLTIHLGREVRLCGPVQYRWMYPIERFMKVLTGYVRNRARPEGCIAERYLAEEYTFFCSKYFEQASDIGTCPARNINLGDGVILDGDPISGGKLITIHPERLQAAHRYVLFNRPETQPYIEMHLDELKASDRRFSNNGTLLYKTHVETFATWIKQKIKDQGNDNNISSTLRWLSKMPREQGMSYTRYVINGFRFHTKDVENARQNSGVLVEATTVCRASARDNSYATAKVSYYGVLKEIILLDYHEFYLPVFRCDWANIINGIKVDDGFTLVNLREGQNQFEKDPFILASQAKQIFYSRENESSSWYVVLQAPPTCYEDANVEEESDNLPSTPVLFSQVNVVNEEPYERLEVDGTLCDA